MNLIIALLTALPEIIKLLRNLEEKQKKDAEARSIKEDIQKINKAFEENDAKALNAIFNNTDSK